MVADSFVIDADNWSSDIGNLDSDSQDFDSMVADNSAIGVDNWNFDIDNLDSDSQSFGNIVADNWKNYSSDSDFCYNYCFAVG